VLGLNVTEKNSVLFPDLNERRAVAVLFTESLSETTGAATKKFVCKKQEIRLYSSHTTLNCSRLIALHECVSND